MCTQHWIYTQNRIHSSVFQHKWICTHVPPITLMEDTLLGCNGSSGWACHLGALSSSLRNLPFQTAVHGEGCYPRPWTHRQNKLFLHFWFWIIPSHVFSGTSAKTDTVFNICVNSLVSQHGQRRCGHPEHTTYQCSCTLPCQTCPISIDVHGSSHVHMPPHLHKNVTVKMQNISEWA